MSREAVLLRRIAVALGGLACSLALILAVAAAFRHLPLAARPLAASLLQAGVPALPLAAILVALGPVLATQRVIRARQGRGAATPGEAARLPALRLVLPAGVAAAALGTWGIPAVAGSAPTPAAIAIATIIGAFPLLLCERVLAGVAPACLPEAADLRRIVLLAVLVTFATGIAGVSSAVGAPGTAIALHVLGILVTLAGLELGGRAVGRCFLPPGRAADARAVTGSLIARIMASTLRLETDPRSFATAVLRDQLGIDISRSWALAYLRAAALPLALVLAVATWSLSALAIVPFGARAVYLRLGAPVAVLHPGLHAILPWPFGAARRVEWGAVHEMALGGEIGPSGMAPARAEDAAPMEADRLWNQPHPGELSLLVASRAEAGTGPATQLFQSVSADLRVFYRVGLDDQAAIDWVVASVSPATLLRSDAARVVAGRFAGSTLAAVLGADRGQMAASLQDRLAAMLAGQHIGLEPVAVSVEAIHPPAGAAEAYHAVRAAQITADATIYAERGRALTVRAQTRQYAFAQTAAAAALAAETTGGAAATQIRFAADANIAAGPDGPAFLLERRFAALQQSLVRKPITVIDARLVGSAATYDLRPPGPATPTIGDGE